MNHFLNITFLSLNHSNCNFTTTESNNRTGAALTLDQTAAVCVIALSYFTLIYLHISAANFTNEDKEAKYQSRKEGVPKQLIVKVTYANFVSCVLMDYRYVIFIHMFVP